VWVASDDRYASAARNFPKENPQIIQVRVAGVSKYHNLIGRAAGNLYPSKRPFLLEKVGISDGIFGNIRRAGIEGIEGPISSKFLVIND